MTGKSKPVDSVSGRASGGWRRVDINARRPRKKVATVIVRPDNNGPRELGRYLLLSPLGSGGMGVVYAAYDPELDRKVAIKQFKVVGASESDSLHSRTSPEQQLISEARALAKLSHPNVLPVFDVGEHEGQVYVATELVEGRNLRDWLREDAENLDPDERWVQALELMRPAGEGIAAAHERGLVHRDIKPDNIMIGNDGRVRVLDFGLAIAVNAQLKLRAPSGSELNTSFDSGTPGYMAPEQMRGEGADQLSDQFAYCVSLLELICGSRPFRAENIPQLCARVEQQRFSEHFDLNACPPWLAKLLLRGMSARPERRFPDLRCLLHAIDARYQNPLEQRRRRISLGLSMAAGLTLIVGWSQGSRRAEENCREGRSQIEAHWNQELRNEAQASFEAANPHAGRELWQDVAARLGQRADAWQDSFEAVCIQHEGTERDLAFDRSMNCVQRSLSEFAALSQGLRHANAATMTKAISAIRGLAPVSACLDVSEQKDLDAGLTGEQRALMAAWRQRWAKVAVATNLGRFQAAADLGHALELEAAALDHPPALADIYYDLARNARDWGQFRSAHHYAWQAFRTATAANHDALASKAISYLALLDGYFSAGDILPAPELLAQSLAQLQRSGSQPELEVEWIRHTGPMLATRYGPASILEDLLRAADLQAQRLGPHHPDTITTVHDIAYTYALLCRTEDADRVFRELAAVSNAALGRPHPLSVHIDLSWANTRLQLGYRGHGLALVDSALDRLRSGSGLFDGRADQSMELAIHALYAAGEYRRTLDLAATYRRNRAQHANDYQPGLHASSAVAASQAILGNPSTALRQLRDALDLAGRSQGHHEPHVILDALLTHADAWLRLGQAASAGPLLTEFSTAYPGLDQHNVVLEARFAIVKSRWAGQQGRRLEQIKSAERGLHLLTHNFPRHPSAASLAHLELARAAELNGDERRAKHQLEVGLATMLRNPGARANNQAHVLLDQAELSRNMGAFSTSKGLLKAIETHLAPEELAPETRIAFARALQHANTAP